jgi:hypothetical protein
MGLIGMLVVTSAPTGSGAAGAGTAYGGGTANPVTYNAEVPMLLSEIDPVQNAAVSNAVNTAGFAETNVWSGQAGGCGAPKNADGSPNSSFGTCYPPAVNYTPLYYLINGVAFNKTASTTSLFNVTQGAATGQVSGTVLVRLVNAGLRMHVPSIVGTQTTIQVAANSVTGTAATTLTSSGFSLVAEDGNQLPGIPHVQSEVFMAAGKTYDVMINVPPLGSNALPVFDRELSLSGNKINRDSGMLAYIGVNSSKLPSDPGLGNAVANTDSYAMVVPSNPLKITDPSKGVIANDVNVFGVKIQNQPANGSVTLNEDGTFTYTPTAASWTSSSAADSFTYCANGTSTICATVNLTPAPLEAVTGITVSDSAFASKVATFLTVKSPGILQGAVDVAGYPLSVSAATVAPSTKGGANGISLCGATPSAPCVAVNADGSFSAYVASPGNYAFQYQAQNTQGTLSGTGGTLSGTPGVATVTINFPTPSGLKVNVVDGVDKTTQISDYRWIIEEDRTFFIDPGCQTNPPPATSAVTGKACAIYGQTGTVPALGVNFHTSDMPFVAQGCTGTTSCESGQMVLDPSTGNHVPAVCDVGNGVCRTTGSENQPVDPSQVALDPTKRYYISVLPGDAANAFITGNATAGCAPTTLPLPNNTTCGHGMGGAAVTFPVTGTKPNDVTVLAQPNPYPPGKLSIFVFEDDFPLNGEVDSGGGVDVLAPLEPGLGGFNVELWDAMGGNNDFTGQMTYDMFNQPLTNSLAGLIDPSNGRNACPISASSSTSFGSGNGVSASASGQSNTITISGLTVDPSQVGNTVVITGGNGFNPGTYTITGVDTGAHTWTLNPSIPGTYAASGAASGMTGTRTQAGITGTITTCPKYEDDGITLSPLAGQAVVENLMPGRFGVIATPAADRIARGEQWLQTNTLDGQKAHDSFVKIGEPSYFQEYGPANFHVTIGFANPAIINSRLNGPDGKSGVCGGQDIYLPGQGNCVYELKGKVTGERLSRTPDERLYSSGSRDAFAWTQCYVSVGDPDGEDFAFTKCNPDGTFDFKGLPYGQWRITTFDQWNDQLVDGLSTPVALTSTTPLVDVGDVAATQWQTNIQTRTFIDDNKDGVAQADETGIPFNNVAVRYRDGSLANLLGTDFSGVANFNETFPLFAWYTIETDVTRYKNTGTHVIYDAGGPADGSASCGQTGYPACGTSKTAAFLANTNEAVPLPTNLRVPGAVYCANADCTGESIATGPVAGGSSGPGGSTGRIDPPWVGVEGWQGFPGQFEFVEFGKTPYIPGENGGIKGHVVYASTRPFDDPQLLVQTQWEPLIPHVQINLYQEGTAPDGTTSLTLVDHTMTSSWDDWVQGFHTAPDGSTVPNMNCPGQTTSDLFYFTLYNQPEYLDFYNSQHTTGATITQLPYNSQYKCYDGMHNWNQVQPAPYDGMYAFPSTTGMDPTTGKSTGTNCLICTAALKNVDPDTSDPYRYGQPMLPAGKYVVEVVVPPGYELVKEEDKNILIGDNYIAPVSQEFGGLGNIFILPDQAAISSQNNPNNAQNPTNSLGASPQNGIVPGFAPEPVWPCVGASRIVPDYISLYPQSQQVSPFAGATRNLCDRKEVTLNDQAGAIAKFYLFTSTHKASKFYGGITDDFTSEFDPFSPQFGEKFAPPNLPVAIRDWSGAEISRVYADGWGAYNGMTYSTWEVNPPNPTGYAPTMMIFCMNDPGPMQDSTGHPIMSNGHTVTDPSFNPGYSQFCYELPYMPGQTQYLDTPVVPTSAFSEGYNHPDCSYPTLTPSISEVDGDVKGPWVNGAKGSVASVTIAPGKGGNYATVPGVTFGAAPAGGTTATGTAVIGPSGAVSTVTVNKPGTYTGTPAVSFLAPAGGGTTAQGTAVVSGYVASINLTNNGGTNYIVAPNVSISGGGGSGATAQATIQGGHVTKITVTNGGSGYTSAPTVTMNKPFLGNAATASATTAKGVTAINVTNGGSNYTTAPPVSITGGGGSGASASATLGETVTSVTITNSGSGYTAGPSVTFATGIGGNTATATSTLNSGGILTITALGDQTVINNAYSGPSATTPPFNQKTITRHYGFGGTQGTVTIGGVSAPIVAGKWSDTSIQVSVPAGVPDCAVQQQAQYGGSHAQCGQLVITSATGQQSVDTVTVTIGGKAPTMVSTDISNGIFGSIQGAIDAAQPGDLIIVPPGTYQELLLMWKPVRLQGVGAASSIINANTQPAGKLDPWRSRVTCFFGLALNGQPATNPANATTLPNAPSTTNTNPFDPTGTYSCGGWPGFNAVPNNPQVDRLPLEGVLGWDTTTNGNLAQLLQEPTLLGAYEGAGITVLSKGVKVPAGTNVGSYYGNGAEATFPTGTQLLTESDCTTGPNGTNPYPSNFQCNPSAIDGLSVTDSSQGGGGIFVHAWAHNIQIANNRVYNNIGTLSGGINIGQGESPDAYLANQTNDTDPGSCRTNPADPTNLQLPYCFDLKVNVHNNMVTLNTSIGDELFSGTPAGAGGVTFCTGADYYKFNYNWICGNMSTGDGGGVAHLGFIWDGDIEHNTVIFNQSTNPTIQTNGGGIVAMGAAPDGAPPGSPAGTECGGTAADADCTPGLPDGTGPGLIINANLIQGNGAESGSGGGVRLQSVNGTEIANFPTQPQYWNSVSLTNNIIVNNVAGWDGAGISLQDALSVNIINNTVASNDATASAGPLFNTIGAPLASAPSPTCQQSTGNPTCIAKSSLPQVAGIVTSGNSPQLLASFTGLTSLTCPAGHSSGTPTAAVKNGDCKSISYPLLYNNVIWQNRSFNINIGGYSNSYQQNTIGMTPMLSQAKTGDCVAGANFWDIGVRGDLTQKGHESGFTLSPVWSVITDAGDYTTPKGSTLAAHNSGVNPEAVSQYCNGSRTPPENGGLGYQVPPGISDATVPNPIFSLTPAATVDEGNNWVNMSWGPLSMLNPVSQAALGNYALSPTSQSIDYVPTCTSTATCNTAQNPFYLVAAAPSTDFYGNARPDTSNPNHFDVGAVEYQGNRSDTANVSPTSVGFGNVASGSTSPAQFLTLNAGATAMTGINVVYAGPFGPGTPAATGACTTTLAANASCTISVVFSPTGPGDATGTATINATTGGPVNGSPVSLDGLGVAQVSVSPSPLNFPNTVEHVASAPLTLTLTNGTPAQIDSIALVFTGDYKQSGGSCSTTLAAQASCTINVVFTPTVMGADPGTLTITSSQPIVNSPVTLNGNGVGLSVSPSTVAFGNVIMNQTSLVQSLIVSNTGGAVTGLTVGNLTAPFTRTGGTCATTMAAGTPTVPTTCTVNIVFHPTAVAGSSDSVSITGNYGTAATTAIGSPVALAGVGVAIPTKPTLTVLDNFNRANATTLGANWTQTNVLGAAAIQLNTNQASCPAGFTVCGLAGGGNATWKPTAFGAKEAAAFTLSNTTIANNGLMLAETGSTAALTDLYTNFIRVSVNGTTATISTTTNNGGAYTTIGSVTAPTAFANGDTITAQVDGTTDYSAPTVLVWRTTSANVTTFLGAIQITPNATWQGGGLIGIQMPGGARIDNFAGGTTP